MVLLIVSAGLAGGLVGASGQEPFPSLYREAVTVRGGIAALFEERPPILIEMAIEKEGVTIHDRERAAGGLTLLQGFMPGGMQARLIDAEGNLVHSWPIAFDEVWPDAEQVLPAKRIPVNDGRYISQGMWPNPDGSIIVSFNALGAAKLDPCGKLVWRTDRPTHHSVTPAGDGNFWIPGMIGLERTEKRLLPTHMSAEQLEAETLTDHNYHESVLLISPDGKTLRELSVLKAIADAGLEGALYQSHTDLITDATHINDIDLVTQPLADRIDGVEVGDLLISSRAMNMIFIMDEIDGTLKWYHQGPWVRQHDPDINADGTISIFNNRNITVGGYDGSQIVLFDPTTRKTTIQHPASEADRFDAAAMGVHQLLENGNRFIVEPGTGRVFEATPEGDVVWDYRLAYDDEYASLFTFAMRLPDSYFTERNWTCSK